ncbi:hypothetical protein QWY99_08745 [Flavobacterium branchiarum]|uniref:Uncharacterized protein n=1 Tax=Flavobacterium branchiarum TaxID=1114870 RepID=A0ABV5FQ00_9FLAO|nr:hypothetical protein [Flavobacterium branchiarum]MDN3673134.1 hypothetical protein [Flavobacterium branchiarum]
METKQLRDLVEKQIEKSTNFWAGRPKMTIQELEAVEKFAKEKNIFFEKAFDSQEKIEKIAMMHNRTL